MFSLLTDILKLKYVCNRGLICVGIQQDRITVLREVEKIYPGNNRTENSIIVSPSIKEMTPTYGVFCVPSLT